MTRLVSEDSRTVVAMAKDQLPSDAKKHGAAVLLYDTFVTLGSWRTDAILVEAISDSGRLVMAVPYRTATSEAGFAVYRPKFVECPEAEAEVLCERFFRGVETHKKGNEVWTKYIDQSR